MVRPDPSFAWPRPRREPAMAGFLRWIGNPFAGDSAPAVVVTVIILVVALLRLT